MRTKSKRNAVIILLIIFLFQFGESNAQQTSFTFDEVFVYNEETLSGDQFLGEIQAIATDKEDNLYILDKSLKHIKKFDKEGKFLRILANGEGRGPGEFVSPSLLSVGTDGKVYVFDRVIQKVVVLSAENEFITEFLLENMPSRMVVDNEGSIYIASYGIPFPVKGDKVFKYTPDENGEFMLERRFVSIPEEIDTRARGLAGNTDKLAFRPPNTLYFALWTPYEIRSYSVDGEKNNIQMERDLPFFTMPAGKPGELINFTGMLRELLPLKNEVLAVRIGDKSKSKELIYGIDFWDGDGKFLGSIKESESGILPEGINFISDNNEFVYVSYNEPEPMVVKYRLVE